MALHQMVPKSSKKRTSCLQAATIFANRQTPRERPPAQGDCKKEIMQNIRSISRFPVIPNIAYE